MANSLTDTSVKAAKATDKPLKLWDKDGLYLYVSPAGSKTWRFKYYLGGKEKLWTIGRYPALSLKDARGKVAEAKEKLANGIDPAEDKQRRKLLAKTGENTVEFIAREWHEKNDLAWSRRHSEDVMERLEKNIFPFISERPIDEIDPPELLAALRKIESRGAIEVAQRVRGIASQFWRYAIATGRATRDPAMDLKGAIKKRPIVPRPAITEPKAVGELLRAIDGFAGTHTVKCAMQPCALTFCRPGEVRAAEWSEIDFAEKIWRIPAEKMKMKREHWVPLSKQAIEVLKDIQQLTGERRFVFPSIRDVDRCMSDMALVAGLRRMGYAKDEMCAHGFRAMASTMLNEMGYNADWIEKQLAHSPKNKIRGAYNRAEYFPERAKMMQDWADYLSGLKKTSRRENKN